MRPWQWHSHTDRWKSTILNFMGTAILWNSLVLKSTKRVLFYITPSISVSLSLHQITFANDTSSLIAEDKHIFESKPTKYIVNVLKIKMTGVVQKTELVALLFC